METENCLCIDCPLRTIYTNNPTALWWGYFAYHALPLVTSIRSILIGTMLVRIGAFW